VAGDWMKVELELPDKPEVHAIAGRLKIDPDAVVGKLIRVWQWFDKHTTDGNAYGVTDLLIDRISGVSGFGEAMSFIGWLEQKNEYLVMPKFDRHTSASAKARALTAKRVASYKAKTNAEGNVGSVSDFSKDALPKEEKRRISIPTSDEVGCAQASPDHQGKKVNDCPHQEIIALYKELIPVGVVPKVWSGTRATHLKARWREDKKHQDLDYWRRLFIYITESSFLMGKVHDSSKRPFEISLDWIVMPDNFAKIIEGKYHGRDA
jgi:hypothetical protein